MRLHLSLDEYKVMGEQRRAFDDWLRVEDLNDKRIVDMTLGEGYVDVLCRNDDTPLTTHQARYPVRSLPPW